LGERSCLLIEDPKRTSLNDKSVHTQNFSENENQNHSDEQPWLLSGTSDTGVTDNTNSETSSKTSKPDGQTSTKLNETGEERSLLGKVVGDQDGNDETVNGNDTSHNDWNNVCTYGSACVSNRKITRLVQRKLARGSQFAACRSPCAKNPPNGSRPHHVLTLDNQIWSKDTHGGDTNTGLGGTVGSTEAGEDNGGGATHRTEEWLKACQFLYHVRVRAVCVASIKSRSDMAGPGRGRRAAWCSDKW